MRIFARFSDYRAKTCQITHSYHIRMYLSSKGKLGALQPVLEGGVFRPTPKNFRTKSRRPFRKFLLKDGGFLYVGFT